MKRIPRFVWVGLATSIALVGFMGFLHTPMGRPVSALFAIGCPVGQVSPQVIEESRLRAARAIRGEKHAPTRLALGFEFEVTTAQDVKAWASGHGIRCDAQRNETFFKCHDVPIAAMGGARGTAAKEVCFQFSPETKRLVNTTVMHPGLTGQVAMERFDELSTSLRTHLGEPHEVQGKSDGQYLDSGYLHRVAVAYHFHDYVAEVSATNVGRNGIMVHQHYMSITD